MTRGTKSLLFGVHQFILHPLLVTIAWVKLYHNSPSWRELICIFIHDWGYWGVEDIKGVEGDKHPEFGAKIANKLFGIRYSKFILGHSTFYSIRNDIGTSKLMPPDKYWHCIIPLWFYKVLSIPSGEWEYYRHLKHARQVTRIEESDIVWWENLQKVCLGKINGCYIINKNKLAK